MSKLLIVVEQLKDWGQLFPTEDLITFNDFIQKPPKSHKGFVINLCRKYKYSSPGYYCSLLAEARGFRALPNVATLNQVASKQTYGQAMDICKAWLNKHQHEISGEHIRFKSYFGQSDLLTMLPLARKLFEQFPMPILEVELRKKNNHWELDKLLPVAINQLSDEEESQLAMAINRFSRKIWRKPKLAKRYQYDLAMLVNPSEKLPPSDNTALKRFIRAGRKLGIDVALITPRDSVRIAEFDALFIRETTSMNHHTYRMAQRAEQEGLVVIDDPTSIMRCTNKVYLHERLVAAKVSTPKTHVLISGNQAQIQQAMADLSLPLVLKLPESAFSLGVHKVKTETEMAEMCERLFKESALILAQEYIPTDFDWRIGVLAGKAIFACRYYMAKGHWQIYKHDSGKATAGGWDTLPVEEAPAHVLDAAIRACACIGDGLYGVDLKDINGQALIIEINDNPSIDSSVEDAVAGEALYLTIMQHFLTRMEKNRQIP